MPADQLEFAGFLPPAPHGAGVPAAPVRSPRVIVLDDDAPRRRRKRPAPTPEQLHKRSVRERRRRDRLATQWVECCGRAYYRTRACHTWWATCHACKQPLTWPRW